MKYVTLILAFCFVFIEPLCGQENSELTELFNALQELHGSEYIAKRDVFLSDGQAIKILTELRDKKMNEPDWLAEALYVRATCPEIVEKYESEMKTILVQKEFIDINGQGLDGTRISIYSQSAILNAERIAMYARFLSPAKWTERKSHYLLVETLFKEGGLSEEASYCFAMGLLGDIDSSDYKSPFDPKSGRTEIKKYEWAVKPLFEECFKSNEPWKKIPGMVFTERNPPISDEALKIFVDALKDDRNSVRSAAILCLGALKKWLNDPLKRGAVLNLIEEWWNNEQFPRIRNEGPKALSVLGQDALPLLEKIAQKDENKEIRESAVEEIRKIKKGLEEAQELEEKARMAKEIQKKQKSKEKEGNKDDTSDDGFKENNSDAGNRNVIYIIIISCVAGACLAVIILIRKHKQ